jgi:hypothetical protein
MQINPSVSGAGYAKLYGSEQAPKQAVAMKITNRSEFTKPQPMKPCLPERPPIRLARPVSAITTEDFVFLKQKLTENPKLKLEPEIKDAALFLREGQDTSIYHTANGDTLLNARPDAEDPQRRHKNWPFQKELSSLINRFEAINTARRTNQKIMLKEKNRGIFSGELSRETGLSGKHIRVMQETDSFGKPENIFFLLARDEQYKDMKSFILKAPSEAKREYITAMKALTKKYPPQLPGAGDKDYCFRTASGELNFFLTFTTEYRPKNGFPYTKSVDNDCHIRRFKRDEADYFLYQNIKPRSPFDPDHRLHESLKGYVDENSF